MALAALLALICVFRFGPEAPKCELVVRGEKVRSRGTTEVADEILLELSVGERVEYAYTHSSPGNLSDYDAMRSIILVAYHVRVERVGHGELPAPKHGFVVDVLDEFAVPPAGESVVVTGLMTMPAEEGLYHTRFTFAYNDGVPEKQSVDQFNFIVDVRDDG